MQKRFITIHKVSDILYWDCPGKCNTYQRMQKDDQLPRGFKCKCGITFWAKQVTQETRSTARLLIEIEEKK